MAGRGRCWACRHFPARKTAKILVSAFGTPTDVSPAYENVDIWPSKHWSEAT